MPTRPGSSRSMMCVFAASSLLSNFQVCRTITGGVRTTARAKLNSSASFLGNPAISPTEMVAPEREKPRKGRHIPCTSPINTAHTQVTSPLPARSNRLDARINSPPR